MECGAQEYFCQTFDLIAQNENLATYLAEVLGHASASTSGFFKIAGQLLEKHGQAIVGLLGLSFGFYKWWRYREQILHKRLKAYLKEGDARLRNAERQILSAIRRPGPTVSPTQPLFANSPLRAFLRRRNWDRTTFATTVENSAERQLTKAIEKIERQIETAQTSLDSLRHQYATAHVLRGAIAASIADKKPDTAFERNTFALNSFRTALQAGGAGAKELEAHQLRKLGETQQALEAYEKLEEVASALSEPRERAIVIARAKRYRAGILQLQATYADTDGNTAFRGTQKGYDLMSRNKQDSAWSLRKPYKPLSGWDLVEEGEINLIAAFVSHYNGATVVAKDHLNDADDAYASILSSLPNSWIWIRKHHRRLEREAKKGLEYVALARQGKYAPEWL